MCSLKSILSVVALSQCVLQVGAAFWQLLDDIAGDDIPASNIQGFVTTIHSYPHTRRPLAVCVDLDSRPLQVCLLMNRSCVRAAVASLQHW